MYSKETLKKYAKQAADLRKHYEETSYEEIRLCIAKGNRKIGQVMNVSLPPVLTCPRCSECMKLCYDIKACLQYPQNVLDARIRNLAILKQNRDEYFSRIDSAMKRRRKNKYFRWHVGGDIPDLDYFVRMVDNARNHPEFIAIWTYTKNYEAVNQYCDLYGKESIPANFHIMFSEWRGMEMINPYGFPEFRVVFNDDEYKPDPKNHHYCPGNCDICKKLNRGCVAGETTYANEH